MEDCVRAPRRIVSYCTLLLFSILSGAVPAHAQALLTPPTPNTLMTTRFQTPLRYEEALTRVGTYYQEQVGRILPLTFPEIAPMRHFETWHDMFVFFEPAEKGMTVTMKRPTEGLAGRIVKTWMLDLAGRLGAGVPLEFKEEPALAIAEADLFASRRDMLRTFQGDNGWKVIPTWEHAGMMVSAAPLSWVTISPVGLHGVHHVKVEAETPSAARHMLARLAQEVQKPGLYAVYSEEVELNLEMKELAAVGQTQLDPPITGLQPVYVPNPDEKYFADKLRADPEIARRVAAAQGQFAIRCRLEKQYRKVLIGWSELAGYSRPTGRFEAERAVGQGTFTGPKPALPTAGPLTLRSKMPAVLPGAYRLRLEAEESDGARVKIDERTYWFDGKIFEEL